MPGSLLLGSRQHSWRSWLQDHDQPYLILDPANSDIGYPATARLVKDGKVVAWRFIGTCRADKNPLAILSAAVELSQYFPECHVLIGEVRSPVIRQLTAEIVRLLRPEAILSPLELQVSMPGAKDVEIVELEASLPDVAQTAQRRAIWIDMLDRCVRHRYDMAQGLEGARLGSGQRMPHSAIDAYIELAASHLHIVSDTHYGELEILALSNEHGAKKVSMVSPSSYKGLLCCLAKQDGEPMGIGIVESFDPESGRFNLLSTAVEGSKPAILQLGTLRVSNDGIDYDATAPWAV